MMPIPPVNYRSEALRTETHGQRSRRRPGAQRSRQEAKLSYGRNVLVRRYRNGLIVDRVWEATGTAGAMRRWKCCRNFREASG